MAQKRLLLRDYYKSLPLDVTNVELTRDSRLFINPAKIAFLQYDENNKHATRKLNDFFDCIKNAKSETEVEKILSHSSEIHYTHLGYALNLKSGNSIGDKYKEKMAKEIISNKYLKDDDIYISDMSVFIYGVSADRISDLSTNVMLDILCEYTESVCKKENIDLVYPYSYYFWDENTHDWNKAKAYLPTQNGNPLIFVPESMITKNSQIKSLKDYVDFGIIPAIRDSINKYCPDYIKYTGDQNNENKFYSKKAIKKFLEKIYNIKSLSEILSFAYNNSDLFIISMKYYNEYVNNSYFKN